MCAAWRCDAGGAPLVQEWDHTLYALHQPVHLNGCKVGEEVGEQGSNWAAMWASVQQVCGDVGGKRQVQ